ncbi:TIGR00282 family metallophosphoesterase ['Camptotheca acuminata' phytoplasma]|uniref:TIGR00282 family metallophosphoesterase n=1 Tax='Camptotheca acuminata' phytoplasma TaxID=3239192 RepID=UPI00351A64AF
MRILFIGDICGKKGVDYLTEKINFLKKKYKSEFVIVNAENVDNGKGLDYENYQNLILSGVNMITMGNHNIYNKNMNNLVDSDNIVRPLNLKQKGLQGSGYKIIKYKKKKILIMNALGRVFMNEKENLSCPFKKIENILKICSKKYDYSFLDFHAQATSEKIALAHHFDGRIDAIIGTHTHVQTNDDRILPKNTVYISDAGMTGPYDGVIGTDKDIIINNFLNEKKQKHKLAEGKRQLNGVVVNLGSHKNIEKINFHE